MGKPLSLTGKLLVSLYEKLYFVLLETGTFLMDKPFAILLWYDAFICIYTLVSPVVSDDIKPLIRYYHSISHVLIPDFSTING
ncbi:hypothetical protein DWV30_18900 [Bacteroides ovatus]|nr:hypothetical protein DWZ47_18490 [Bacteroides sp. AF32-8BH]RGX20162.1 hypothetical protein DWV30_18900 [Bacteroides ovatus]